MAGIEADGTDNDVSRTRSAVRAGSWDFPPRVEDLLGETSAVAMLDRIDPPGLTLA